MPHPAPPLAAPTLYALNVRVEIPATSASLLGRVFRLSFPSPFITLAPSATTITTTTTTNGPAPLLPSLSLQGNRNSVGLDTPDPTELIEEDRALNRTRTHDNSSRKGGAERGADERPGDGGEDADGGEDEEWGGVVFVRHGWWARADASVGPTANGISTRTASPLLAYLFAPLLPAACSISGAIMSWTLSQRVGQRAYIYFIGPVVDSS
ncbi:hypothetical protein BDQ12DRAFT_735089 [Crucibulum laeve]|uniref:Uncharacterized protein n=1 Tax=Crucibulum laeve TaxID=68775 RepID=A0A5C3MCH1_9AGAR|nr:hypothetical protein BDQ12DRAFT_735089 [Crucibulum laeve]